MMNTIRAHWQSDITIIPAMGWKIPRPPEVIGPKLPIEAIEYHQIFDGNMRINIASRPASTIHQLT